MSSDETCWTVIRAAAHGDGGARSQFAHDYEDVVRAYLLARWGSGPHRQDVDDAVQQVFLECFKERGVLARSDGSRGSGFRAFLVGVARNVARRVEERRARDAARPLEEAPSHLGADEETLGAAFDRAWAELLMRRAAERMAARAAGLGDAARRRVELLRLRFGEDTPLRDIAAAWAMDPARVHHDYAKAREEFRAALHAEVAFHRPGSAAEVDAECAGLLALLA